MLRKLSAIVAFVLALVPPAAAQVAAADAGRGSPEAPAISDFLAEPSIVDIALAPGGGHIAYVQRQDGVSYLVVRGLDDPESKRQATRLGNVHVYGLKWVNDDRLVYSAGSASISIDYKRGQLIFSGVPRLFAIGRDLKGGMAFFQGDKKITNANVISTSDISLIPGDSESFLVPLRVGRNLDLVRVNVRDGKWTSVAKGAEMTVAWFVDRTGKPAMRIDSNRRFTEIRVMTPEPRNSGEIRWRQAQKFRLGRDTAKSLDFTPVAPGPAPNLYYVIGRPPGADRTGIHLYDVDAQQFASEVYTHPRADISSAYVDPNTGAYLGASYWDDKLEMIFVDKKMQAHFDGLNVFFGHERSISFIDSSSDHQVWVLATSGPRDPGSFHVYDMAAAKSEIIGARNLHLQEGMLGKSQRISYKARDGLDIVGYLTLPPGLAEGTKPPLIVYPHGGPEVRAAQAYDVTVQFLATRGYAVFQPNFRGSSGYGKAFAEAGRRQFGGAMQTDVADGVQRLIESELVDPVRICIMGESYGGYAALMGVVQFPDLYRCAVSASGPSDLYRQVRWEREEEGADSEAYRYWVEQVGDPRRDKAEMEAISPINNIAAINAPIMLMHGVHDDTVPFEQSDLMHKALKKAGKVSTIVRFEGAGHSFTGSDLEAYLTHLEKFFEKHLSASSH